MMMDIKEDEKNKKLKISTFMYSIYFYFDFYFFFDKFLPLE